MRSSLLTRVSTLSILVGALATLAILAMALGRVTQSEPEKLALTADVEHGVAASSAGDAAVASLQPVQIALHQTLPQAELRMTTGTGVEARQTPEPEPFLLADYAAQCRAYMGEVPEFSCTDPNHENTLEYLIVEPDLEKEECPRLFSADTPEALRRVEEQTCSVRGSRVGQLKPQATPPGTDVTIMFGCRVYDDKTAAGHFDDINVIQFDSVTGNTCWFNSPIAPALDEDGNISYDRYGNLAFKDIPGANIPSPMETGADRFWLHPYHPDDEQVGRSWVENVAAGRRGVLADMNCQRCHDSDPFIWTPILAPKFPITGGGSQSAFHGKSLISTPYVSNFAQVFNADGFVRHQPARINPASAQVAACTQCHLLGVRTLAGFPTGADDEADGLNTIPIKASKAKIQGEKADEDDKRVTHFLHLVEETTRNNNIWMPPPNIENASDYPQISAAAIDILTQCAQNPAGQARNAAGEMVDCNPVVPAQKQSTVVMNVAASPYPLVAGQSVRYTALIHNRGPHATTGLTLTATLPDGVTFVDSPNLPACRPNDEQQVECPLGSMATDETRTIMLRGRVAAAATGDLLTSKVTLTTDADTTAINLKAVEVTEASPLRRDADLALDYQAQLELNPSAGQPPRLRYHLTVHNHGPAVAAEVTITVDLPAAAQLERALSSPTCTQAAAQVQCVLDALDSGSYSSINVVASAPQSSGPFYVSSATAASGQPDYRPADNAQNILLFDVASVQQLHLPLIANSGTSGAVDLVVRSIDVDEETARVTIQNIGRDSLSLARGFWVDLYVDPLFAPTGVNQVVSNMRTRGLVWGVIDPSRKLGPGEELTLEIGDEFFAPSLSKVPTTIEMDSMIYAQVDSADLTTTYGSILETHEADGEAYNNIFAMHAPETIRLNWTMTAISAAAMTAAAHEDDLPARP